MKSIRRYRAFAPRAAIAALTLGMLGAQACAAPVTDASDTEDRVASENEALVRITPSNIAWKIGPRAASSYSAYSNVHQQYSSFYVHPSIFEIQLTVTTPQSGAEYKWDLTRADANAQHTATEFSTATTGHLYALYQGVYQLTLSKRVAGVVSTVETKSINVRDVVIAIVGDSMSSGEGDPDKDNGPDGPHVWMDPQCHRSMNSGSARAALQFEHDNPHLSVTLIDYACSGAVTTDIFSTVQHAPGVTQLAALKRDLDNGDGTVRPIDHMLMTIGINNLYFHDLMVDCLSPINGGCDTEQGPDTRRHVTDLDNDYDVLALGIAQSGIPINKVHLVEYPASDVFKNDSGALEACGLLDRWGNPDDNPISPVPIGTNLSTDELTFLHQTGVDLIAMASQNADANGWDYIGGVDAAFNNRGYCSSDARRYFNNYEDSKARQSDDHGMFHPNKAGYTAMGGIVAAVLDASEREFLQAYPIEDSWTTDFNDASGWSNPDQYSTLQFPDVDGDGFKDVCGRGPLGVYCARSNGTSFGTPTLWNTTFTDANHFDQARYYSTIKYPDLNRDGKADICARDANGIMCAMSNGTSFDAPTRFTLAFADSDGYGDPKYYSSIDFPDIDRDGRPDVCGRGPKGMMCGVSFGPGPGMFYPVKLMVPWEFTDAQGWGSSSTYFDTIRYPDVNGDGAADICGRGPQGIVCAMSLETRFDVGATSDFFADANGFGTPDHSLSIGFPDVNGDGKADVCGRNANGLFCALSQGGGPFKPARLWNRFYSDAAGWSTQASFYATIQYPDLNGDGKADVCGRSYGGMFCAVSTGLAFANAGHWEAGFSDANGGASPSTYETITFADVDHDHRVEMCGRKSGGITCWNLF